MIDQAAKGRGRANPVGVGGPDASALQPAPPPPPAPETVPYPDAYLPPDEHRPPGYPEETTMYA